MIQVEDDGPEDGGGEENRENLALSSEDEAGGTVWAVEFAEAVFECGAPTAFAGSVQIQALRSAVN